MSTLEQVLSYWFPAGHDADEESYRRQVRWWFAGGPEVDRQIAEKFSETLVQDGASLIFGLTRRGAALH
jgi:uncharacterized protein (DUF924 family)